MGMMRHLPSFARTVEREREEPDMPTLVLPSGADALEHLQAIYQETRYPLNVRVKAMIEALPYERPKAHEHKPGEDFASRLENARKKHQLREEYIAGLESRVAQLEAGGAGAALVIVPKPTREPDRLKRRSLP
jgi:hypothetical protein